MRKFRVTKLQDDWIGVEPIAQSDPNKFRGFTKGEAVRLGLAETVKDVCLSVGRMLMLELDDDGFATRVQLPKIQRKKSKRKWLPRKEYEEIHGGGDSEPEGDLSGFWDEN